MAKRLRDLMLNERWSVEEFLELDDGTDTRYELVRGELVAMAPPTASYSRLLARLGYQLSRQLRRPCEPMALVGIWPDREQATFFLADIAVSCEPPSDTPWCENPVLIAEIRSASTERHDQVRKLVAYQGIPSVRDILLVDSLSARIDHFAREESGWRQTTHIGTAAFELTGLAATIDLGDLYEGMFASPAG